MKKLLAILLSVTMLLGCVVFSTAVSAETTAFEIGAGVNYIPLYNENVKATLGSGAIVADIDWGKTYSELRTDDKFEFAIDVATAGTYYFSMTYAWAGDTTFAVSVDGGAEVTLACPATGGWQSPIKSGTPSAIELTAGEHNVTIRHSQVGGGANMVFAVNICDSAEAEITYPVWRYAASTMPGAATGAKDAAGQAVAYHANVLQAFDGFYFSMATWGVSTAYCKLAVYKWAYNYENTLAGEPIATAEFNPMADNTSNGIDFDEALPAGEYLFYIYDTSAEKCGIYCCEGADEKGVTYVGGVVDTTWIPALGIKIDAGFGEGTEILGVASEETEVPTFHPIADDEATVLNILEKGAWSENNLEATQHAGSLTVDTENGRVIDFRYGDTATFNINVAKTGTYALSLNHVWAAPSNWTVTIDGAEAVLVVISQSPDWSTPVDSDLGAYELTAGDHTITLTCAQEDSGQHIYALTVTPPMFEAEVAVDTQGATEDHGLTVTAGVGGLGLSYQFKTNAAFKAFAPKVGLFDSTRTLNISITKRGSDEPIQSWDIVGDDVTGNNNEYWNDRVNNGAWVTCELDEELPAGEYIVSLMPTDGMNDVVWKKFNIKDELGIFESVGSFDGEKETARNSTPAFKVTFTEEVADGAYFAKAGEPNVVAVDNQGAEEAHGLTITNGVGGLGLSYQFKTTAAFEAFSIKFGFFSADKAVNVAITALDSEEPVKTWTPNGFEGVDAGDSTGAWATFELDSELPAGEYIIAVSPAEGTQGDVIWKKYAVADANGLFESVGSFEGEKETARSSTPCLTFTFTEFADDNVYFVKAGETPVEPEDTTPEDTTPEDTTPEDTTPEDTTPEDTTAEDTTAEDTTAADTTAADTTAADTTAADTTAADTTAADTTAAGTTAAGTTAAGTTAAAASEGCKAVVGSMSAIALVAIASAAAVVLKKKED